MSEVALIYDRRAEIVKNLDNCLAFSILQVDSIWCPDKEEPFLSYYEKKGSGVMSPI